MLRLKKETKTTQYITNIMITILRLLLLLVIIF